MAYNYDIPFHVDLTDRVALVTGGNGGIGGMFCRALAACGATVIVLGRNLERCRMVADEINAGGGKADAIAGDVTDEAAMLRVKEEIAQKYGRLNILINAAGGAVKSAMVLQDQMADPGEKTFFDVGADDIQKEFDLNMRGTWLPSKVMTPLLIGQGYRTFPVEIYNAFFSETTGGDYGFACATSVIAIVITTVVFLVQKWSSNKFSFTMNALHPVERKKAHGLLNVLIHLFTYLVVGIAFLPQVYIFYESFRKTSGKAFVPGYSLDSYRSAMKVAGSAIKNTFVIGIAALVLIILLAVLVAYLVIRRKNTVNNVIDVISMLPYIIPGSVVGIALIMAFNRKPLILTGTMIIMVIALVIRRLPYTIRSSVATLQQIPITVEEAAISLGSSKAKTFFQITVPMMANGIISGAILSWVTIITELSTAICLYTVRTQTLTLAIYTYVSRGNDGIAAALATILSLTTVVSLLLFMKLSKSKDVTL